MQALFSSLSFIAHCYCGHKCVCPVFGEVGRIRTVDDLYSKFLKRTGVDCMDSRESIDAVQDLLDCRLFHGVLVARVCRRAFS